MKELDFDELDRAVNTLMSDVPRTASPMIDNDAPTTTLEIPSTLADDQAVPAYTPSVEPPVVVPAPTTAAPAARRGGRFMDVVHPSSDMKTASNTPTRPVSRQGVMISPVITAEQPKAISPVETEPTPVPAPQADVSAWPDPLDMAGYHREPDTTVPSTDAPEPEFIPETSVETLVVAEKLTGAPIAKSDDLDEEAPLSTPFLSGAKVEKRPLGMSSVEEPDRAPVVDAAGLEADTPDAENQLPAMPEATPTVLPAELQTDVLSIESDIPIEPSSEATEEEPAETVSSAVESVAADEIVTPTGPTSIMQQYKEQPSTGDQTTGGIYDTESLHQPLTHPAKKKSGWMWVVWVLILLILGAAGGAAAYLYLLK